MCLCKEGNGRKQTKAKYDSLCFLGERRWSTRLGGGSRLLEGQLHSTSMETRGVCVCVNVWGLLTCFKVPAHLFWTLNHLPGLAHFTPSSVHFHVYRVIPATVCRSFYCFVLSCLSDFPYFKQDWSLASCFTSCFMSEESLLAWLANITTVYSNSSCLLCFCMWLVVLF